MADSEKYNGWTNYETWAVALWIGNSETSYSYWREIAREIHEEAEPSGSFSAKDQAEFALADKLRDEICNASPLAGDATLYSDLLGAALSEVNWGEVARAQVDE